MKTEPSVDSKTTEAESSSSLKNVFFKSVVFLILIAGYFGLSILSSRYGSLAGKIPPIWPAAGLAVAGAVIWGREMIWAVGIAHLLFTFSGHTGIAIGILESGGVVLETYLASTVILKLKNGAHFFESVKETLQFIGTAALICTLPAAVLGSIGVWLTHPGPISHLPLTIFTWWQGDALGIIILTPLLISIASYGGWRMNTREWAERISYLALLAVTSLVVFGFVIHISRAMDVPFIVSVLLLPPIFRWGPVGVMIALNLIAAVASLATALGIGPFVYGSSYESMLLLTLFLLVISSSILIPFSIVRERKRMFEELANTTRALAVKSLELERSHHELTRSNEDLENFAYACSHDLKEPLRMISMYSELLETRAQPPLEGASKSHLDVVRQAVKRMSLLIDDLLRFSRVGKSREFKWERADSRDLVEEALGLLSVTVNDTQPLIRLGHLPAISCDRGRMVQLFQNLISNALKFCPRDRTPEIDINCHQEKLFWIFSIRDRGVGIDEQHHHRIFEMFKRLHDRKIYPGSGIGLATSKKIVEAHGGRIWVESHLNEGAVFYFSIPTRKSWHLNAPNDLVKQPSSTTDRAAQSA